MLKNYTVSKITYIDRIIVSMRLKEINNNGGIREKLLFTSKMVEEQKSLIQIQTHAHRYFSDKNCCVNYGIPLS